MNSALTALIQVVLIDITLAGDNAIVVATAAAALPPALQRKAILAGIAGATLIRVLLSIVAVHLLQILGLTLAGGLLLLWVCWKIARDLLHPVQATAAAKSPSLKAAIFRITLADLSMSLDNVLAVAGAARDHIAVMIAGLTLSIVLAATAASLLTRLLHRHRWLSWLGLAIVAYVATRMIIDGSAQLARHIPA
jgi:YjbE family integral membrane protein